MAQAKTPLDLFNDALEIEAGDRGAFLDGACTESPQLRAEVESLLAAHLAAQGFLSSPWSATPSPEVEVEPPDRLIGARVGPYEIVDTIAVGGMGTVYRAVRMDREFDRTVAIKLLRGERLTGRARHFFHLERQLLAGLDHPSIAKLLDGGTTDDGRPYLVMEFVDGLPIDRYCDDQRLGIRQRLDLFAVVCDAVDYAHRTLVVHRDLKPGNILVTPEGSPKLLDFGIARVQRDQAHGMDDVTVTVAPAMTPGYASPEQVRGERITTATDVYSLGVVLYELLTGLRPYPTAGGAYFDLVHAICEFDPPPPSATATCEDRATLRGERARQLRRRLRGDVDNIVLTALQKDPARRYVSARELAEDIRRHLAGLPVVARRGGWGYRAAKTIRRNRGLATAAALLVVSLAGGLLATNSSLVRARHAESAARTQRDAALRAQAESTAVTAFLEGMLSAANPYGRGHELSIMELLEETARRIPTELRDEPGVEAGVRLAIARTYAGLWEWTKATPHLRRALKLYEELYGENDERVADCLSVLGRAMTFDRSTESLALQRRGLEIRRARFGPTSAPVAESLGNLGFALWHGQRPADWVQAEEKYREALAMYAALNIADHPDVARFTFSLGVMLQSIGRLAESERLLAEAGVLYRNVGAPQDRYLAACLEARAAVLERLARHEEAEEVRAELQRIVPVSLAKH